MTDSPIAFCDDVCDILDVFYERNGAEPDWAAIGTKIYHLEHPREAMLEILKIMHLVYEDEDVAAIRTEIFANQNP
jgi:hypothetical protein